MAIYNLFEQSGTFKNQEKKLFYKNCYDVDILNNFKQTDFQLDIFNEIEKGFKGEASFFDRITKDDLVFCFFPCQKFTEKIFLNSKCKNNIMSSWPEEKKIIYSMDFIDKVNKYYSLFCKIYHIFLTRKIRAIIENPYPNLHFLDLFFPFSRSVIDSNRSKHFDFYKKPTGFYFINFPVKQTKIDCLPKERLKPIILISRKNNEKKEFFKRLGVERNSTELNSLIAPQYAEWFIRSYVLDNYKGDSEKEPERVTIMLKDEKYGY